MVKFLSGVNNPWFGDSYANDLGINQFSGAEVWHWPYTDPVPIDLTMPDPNPPTPLLTSQPQLINQYFQQIQGIDVVRIWLFEGLEGIRFDPQKKIIGIDNHLLSNLIAILNSANNAGVKVYLCLFDAWVVKSQPPTGLPQQRVSIYQGWKTAVRKIMKDLVDNPSDFVNNVLTPLVNAIGNHPAAYAIDIMNEPEGMTQDTSVVSDSSMRNFISQCCTAIRPQLKASVGCMWKRTAMSYSKLPIDFCDFHSYNESGNLDPYIPRSYDDKPCVIGECGYPVNSSNVTARSADEVQTAENFVNRALDKGYSACLVWNKNFTSQSNNALIVQWLKQFGIQNNEVRPPSASPFALFVALLMMLFIR